MFTSVSAVKHLLTILSHSHGDVDFQVRACAYIHMDGIGFLVTAMKTEQRGGGGRQTETSHYHRLKIKKTPNLKTKR